MRPVEVVKISNLIPIYKEGEEANSIQVAHIETFSGDQCEFNIVVGKSLYNIGDTAVYIQPDYCIPQTSLFNEYWFPGGDEKKCKLGKKGRIRAIKFNFRFAGETDPIYSNGILLPYNEYKEYVFSIDTKKIDDESFKFCVDHFRAKLNPIYFLTINYDISYAPGQEPKFELQELLGVTKYVAEDSCESMSKGLSAGDRPTFLYETDEERIELHKGDVQRCFEVGEFVSGSIKRDGSSLTIFCKKDESQALGWRIGVCSRKQEKKLDQSYTKSYAYGDYELHPYIQKETNIKGWYCDATTEFFTEADVADVNKFQPITVEVRDNWVDTVKKYSYLTKLLNYCIENDIELALRGELIGAGNKGSRNKLNLDAKLEQQVVWFGVDDLKSGHSRRIHYGQEYNLAKLAFDLDINIVEDVFQGIYDYDSLIKACHEIFNKIKYSTGQIIEGIVIRSKYSNNLSVKYINPEYDSKS